MKKKDPFYEPTMMIYKVKGHPFEYYHHSSAEFIISGITPCEASKLCGKMNDLDDTVKFDNRGFSKLAEYKPTSIENWENMMKIGEKSKFEQISMLE